MHHRTALAERSVVILSLSPQQHEPQAGPHKWAASAAPPISGAFKPQHNRIPLAHGLCGSSCVTVGVFVPWENESATNFRGCGFAGSRPSPRFTAGKLEAATSGELRSAFSASGDFGRALLNSDSFGRRGSLGLTGTFGGDSPIASTVPMPAMLQRAHFEVGLHPE